MPLCGFNQKMFEGLTAFHEGLVEHGLVDRSRIRGESINQTIEREISDMDRFLGEIRRIKDPQIRDPLEFLTRYAKSFYLIVQRDGVKNYEQTIQRLRNLYVEMDSKFYRELEGRPNDMVQLAEYLNGVGV